MDKLYRFFDVLSMVQEFELAEVSPRKLYLLIDTVCVSGFWDYWNNGQLKQSKGWLYLFEHSAYQGLMPMTPLLVEVEEGEFGERLFYWILEQEKGIENFGLVIVSHLSLTELHQQWLLKLDAITPSGEEELLPTYMVQCLLPWWKTLPDHDKNDFMQGMDYVYVPETKEGDLRLLARVNADLPGEANSVNSPYPLTEEQYQILIEPKRHYSMAIELFFRLSAYLTVELSVDHIYHLFLESIKLARELFPHEGLKAHETFATHRFILGTDYHLHPEFIRLSEQHGLYEGLRLFQSTMQYQAELDKDYNRPEWLIEESTS